ncbi:MAG: hypothetical protein ACOC8F_05225 [Planctomycetota bacterium]
MSEIDFPTQPQHPTDPLAAAQAAHLRAAGGRSDAAGAAKDFESVLLGKLLDAMKRTIPDSGLLSTGVSKQVQDLFWMYLSRELADSGGLGLWKDIARAYGGAEPPATGQTEPKP